MTVKAGGIVLRFIHLIISAITVALFSSASPAYAQFEDIGGILEDILGSGQLPGQTPIYGETGIENIPVLVRFDDITDYANPSLILTAYAPNDPNGANHHPKVLGQTRLLITGLTPPIQLTIPVPRNITTGLAFARITAEVVDENENQILGSDSDGIYRGKQDLEMTLKPLIQGNKNMSRPVFTGFETISGEVSFYDREARLNGGQLTIQLLENALAGGNSVTIVAETIIPIDGKSLPISFSVDRGLSENTLDEQLAFKAWIIDWAGRKTHVMRRPVPYNGPDIDYKLKLDVLAQGANTQAGRNLDPNLMAQTTITGEALYDARAPMPSDARLKVTLSRAVGAVGENRVLSTQIIIVRRFEGRVPFSLAAASTHFDPLIPAPLLNLQIVDRNDRVYFDSGDISSREGHQNIQLYTRRF